MESDYSLLESASEIADESGHILESSDEYHEFQCSTCLKEGKNVNAEMYCVECDHYLCQTCLKQHNKFDSMKHHQVVKNASCSGKDEKRKRSWMDLPSQRCEEHHGKLIDMYCRDHNEVCCGTCSALKHSSCPGMLYLPQMANVTDVKKEAKGMLKEMDKLESTVTDLSDARHLQAVNLKAEKDRLSDQIKDSCSKVIKHFKTLELDALKQLDYKADAVEEDVNAEIKKAAELMSSIKSEHHLLAKHLTADNLSSLFVQLKLAEKCWLNCNSTLNQFKTSCKTNLEFSLNYRAAGVVNEIESLGDIFQNKTIKSISLNDEFDVKSPKENSTCDITDIIMHNNGNLLIPDFQNKSLKRLDRRYRVVESLPLPGQPNAVCFVGSSSLAVALTDIKVVQFVRLTSGMALSSSFSVINSCRGIAHKDGLIYVTCGGNHKYGEGKGVMYAYSYSGEMLKTFDTDLALPKHILKHKDGDRMYVVDSHKCLLIMTTDGRILERRIFRDIVNPKGICSGPGNQHFMSGYNSNTIILLSGNAYQICTLNVEGVTKPQALCFDQNKSRLIVAMDNTNAIKVLDVTFE